MHGLAQFVQFAAAPLLWLADQLVPALAVTAHRDPAGSDFTVAAFAVTTGMIGLVCAVWAVRAHLQLVAVRLATAREHASADTAIRLRDAVIGNGRHSVLLLGADLKSPISYGKGSALLEAALAGRSAATLASALESLLSDGTPFALSVPAAGEKMINVRAMPVGGRAVVFLEEYDSVDTGVDYRAVLESSRIPVWVRDQDLELRWANPAFLAATGAGSLQQAQAANALWSRSERLHALAARDGREPVQARRQVNLGGKQRAFATNLWRIPDAGVAGLALDVTEQVKAEARLQMEADASADMLDKLSLAIAVFGADHRLISHNATFSQLWRFPEDWLVGRPSLDEMLDRLREQRLLPEQRDFAVWKRDLLANFDEGAGKVEYFWHRPDGLSLHVVAEPHLQGGLFFTFEDITDSIQLKASLTMLQGVQKATLDTFDDAMAIFAPDGRLVLNNALFARLWQLEDGEMSGEPHFTRLAGYAAARIGRDASWDIVSAAVVSADPERYNEWGKVTRADGRTIALDLSRLPNGATLVAYHDVTEIERFQAALRDTKDRKDHAA